MSLLGKSEMCIKFHLFSFTQMKELQKEFLEELKLGESLELTLALIQANVDWMQHHGSDIKNWMQTQARDEEQSAP